MLAQDAGSIPLPEDYTQFIPKVGGDKLGSFVTKTRHIQRVLGAVLRACRERPVTVAA